VSEINVRQDSKPRIKAVVVKLKMLDLAKDVDEAEKVVNKSRGLVASFCSLALLADPALSASSKKGKALRAQLTNTKDLVESKAAEYTLPAWLMDRVHIAIGLQTRAGGEA
jgi:hypothetical protein